MNKETYEALKKIIYDIEETSVALSDKELQEAIKQVKSWIDEVAKEYEEEN